MNCGYAFLNGRKPKLAGGISLRSKVVSRASHTLRYTVEHNPSHVEALTELGWGIASACHSHCRVEHGQQFYRGSRFHGLR
jgi:hypothetical protein